MSVSREEFDALVDRVNRLEVILNATVEMVAAEIVGIRTWIQEQLKTGFNGIGARFDAMDTRLDGIDTRFDGLDTRVESLEDKIDAYAAQVNAAMRSFDAQAARHERFTTVIAGHFNIDLGENS